MILATPGHIAAGINEKAIPSNAMGIMGFIIVKVRVKCATISNIELKTIIEALLPLMSAIQPKNGVKSTVQKIGIEVNFPASAVVMLNLLCKRSVAYFKKG